MAFQIEPFYFGTSERRIFGIYHPPSQRSTQKGVVICPPLLVEYERTHACLRRLAMKLAGSGVHVLRFDYYGVGDSGGSFEATTPADWERDIGAAVSELCAISGLARVKLVGVRLGGTLAAQVLLTHNSVESIVMWDPVCDGAAYLGQLRESQRRLLRTHYDLSRRDLEEVGRCQELVGFAVGDEALRELDHLSLPEPEKLSSRARVVLSNGESCDGIENGSKLRVAADCDWANPLNVVFFGHEFVEALAAQV